MPLQFTGEFFLPGQTPKRLEEDPVERYKFACRFVEGKTVLDIACGVGDGSNIMAEFRASWVDGVDISKDVIEYAQSNYQVQNLSFHIRDISQFKPGKIYDVIIGFETIEHVEDHQAVLLNLYSLLKEGGMLIISFPNRTNFAWFKVIS